MSAYFCYLHMYKTFYVVKLQHKILGKGLSIEMFISKSLGSIFTLAILLGVLTLGVNRELLLTGSCCHLKKKVNLNFEKMAVEHNPNHKISEGIKAQSKVPQT